MPIQLLWQQAGRAGVSTGAAAYAGHGGRVGAQVLRAQGQDAVRGLDHWHVGSGERKSHHRSAHDEAHIGINPSAGLGEQFTDRGADTYPQIAGIGDARPGHRDHAVG